ncbi:MAG: hypothetical protein OEV66_11695 [Spirochaetia bacterium]|nr:hypothetical protein [Spirochaetia bacterium]
MRALKKEAILLLVLPFLISGLHCARSVHEKEPDNNYPYGADKLKPSQKFIGSFYSKAGTDIDYVYIAVNHPAMITGRLSAVKGVDSEILFSHMDETYPYKQVNDNKSSLYEKFGPFFIDSPGVIIALRPMQPANDEKYIHINYEFQYEIQTPLPSMEIEANDTLEQANPIFGNMARGYYNNALANNSIEKDFFYIDLPKAQKYRLSTSLSGTPGIDAVLRLYAGNGDTLLTVDDTAVGGKENIFSYGVFGPTRMYFSVNSKDSKTSDARYYELQATAQLYEDKYELEPNDVIREATPIKTNQIFGDFSNRQDVDYYKYFNETLEPVNLSIEVAPASDDDIRLELFPQIKSLPIVFDDGGEGVSEGIAAWYIKPLETVYLKLSHKNQSGTGAYVLNALTSPVAANQEREPNNTRNTANSISTNETFEGHINPSNDIDYYRIKAGAQGKYNIDLESPLNCEMNVSILDSKGIKTEGKTASRSGENIFFQTILDPGSYILVRCENAGQALYKSLYRLEIKASE